MNMPFLDIQPRTLKFPVDLKKQTTCLVQLTNTTDRFVAFKVKTTSPKKYCVRPNVGVVAPNSSCEFSVIMQAFKEPPPDLACKDKFLIQSTAVPADTTDEDITASMFSKAEGKHIEENKLRVTLVMPSDSPEPSPVKGATKQEAVFEDSTLLPPQYESEIVKATYGAKELVQPKKGVTDFIEDLNPANDLKPTQTLDTPTNMAMEFPGDQRFNNGLTSVNGVTNPDEPKMPREREVVQAEKRDGDGYKLVKDIEEMKMKVKALESKLQQADSTISKLMEERSIGTQHRESLQQELAEMRTKKIVKEKHVGFPLLYVCVVAFINIVIGYSLRT